MLILFKLVIKGITIKFWYAQFFFCNICEFISIIIIFKCNTI